MYFHAQPRHWGEVTLTCPFATLSAAPWVTNPLRDHFSRCPLPCLPRLLSLLPLLVPVLGTGPSLSTRVTVRQASAQSSLLASCIIQNENLFLVTAV